MADWKSVQPVARCYTSADVARAFVAGMALVVCVGLIFGAIQ